ncbi:diguanylate cyclase (GGDEF) domain-containing protein [Colwellia chukchiensis]|uniref:diguanylate cyclase n=1 Tax=Colwellia chukchiensis TaxID=641665 RepID=A0A1H7IX93_9GAMM|nr:GGDEF domain-containing protein [Colwellia chukchiensis]SEK67018.1 diguanylate cyclase (GGDEF) domain-containing protein [Colwellia chukchiensis]
MMISKNLGKPYLCCMLLLLAVFSGQAVEFFEQQDIDNNLELSISAAPVKPEPLTINVEILSLKVLSEQDPKAAQEKLPALLTLATSLNHAEQYLLYLIRANIAESEGQKHKVINWLNQAIKLEPSLAKKQLDSPLFASAYLTLADIYQQQGDHKKAYDSKKQYIKKYFAHLKQQKALRVKRLNEKYNVEKQHEENELLSQSNQIKQYALIRAASEKQLQNRSITIFIAVAVVLFLLILRQFKIRKALKQLAKTDPLTGLPNRGTFFTLGDSYYNQALQSNRTLSVLMLDIDDFAAVNDSFGHDAADQVLAKIANIASEAMRSRDFLARIDGEEFAAILPDADLEQARAIAEHIREKIKLAAINVNQQTVNICVSIGLASVDEANQGFDNLLQVAESALQQAKSQGGDQVYSKTMAAH